jgi:alkylhydroperoxidase/carboxymuconolactone decarboxylase family protein YurZ/quercetin dioxygenase-like cupin family protein
MMPIKVFWMLALFVSCLSKDSVAQQPMSTKQHLDKKQQAIVTIAAFTAKGDLIQLQKALNDGLNIGLTINEIKEAQVQLYAYTGFPRSLNGLNTFMTVLEQRRSKGIRDLLGKEPSLLPTDKSRLQFGTEMQTKLVGRPVKGEVYEFAPAIDQFLKEHLFGDIFGRDNLDWKTRELVTIAALAAFGGVEGQLRSHFSVGMYNGLTKEQLQQLVSIIQSEVGTKEGHAASQVLQSVLKQTNTKNDKTDNEQDLVVNAIFPKGEKITNDNFAGSAWLHSLIIPDSTNQNAVGSVTFAPGARTKWHSHPAGQILLATGGLGYYQEKGSAKRLLRKGEVVKCPPNVPHWHGASHEQPFIQIAITNRQNGQTEWLQHVTDEEYDSMK